MPSHEEVAESIQRVQNHTNKIITLETVTVDSKAKEVSLEGIISLLQKCYNEVSGSINILSGSIDELRKLVNLKIGGVK